jgi:hypothetical protein
VFRTHD